MRIGMICALSTESTPFAEVMEKAKISPITYPDVNGFTVTEWILGPSVENTSVFLITCGTGIIPSAAAAQLLIDKYSIDKMINYGVVGGLKRELKEGSVGYVKKVIKHDLDCTPFYKKYLYPEQKQDDWTAEDAFDMDNIGIDEFICASGDKVILAGDPKINLQKETGADICDMESASIVWVCRNAKVPLLIIKAISDGVDEDEEAFQANIRQGSKKCAEVVRKAIGIKYPNEENKEQEG